jgi:uncharacterized protein (TIGR00255 family)
MTGYGKQTILDGGREVTVELKSVNNRYLDINCRIPKFLSRAEDVVRRTLKGLLARGSVDVYFYYENRAEAAKRLEVNLPLAGEYLAAAKVLADELGAEGTFSVAELIRTPDVIRARDAEAEDGEALDALVKRAVEGAAAALTAMRETEGAGIAEDLKRLTGRIERLLKKAETRAPGVVTAYRAKLAERIAELLDGIELDQVRLLNETAFMADKLDINEEISRLRSHLTQFYDCIENSEEPKGRKLDFLSQEMNREINTMGSKSNDRELTECVIGMKNELEKIKEQIRNVE